MNVKAVKATTRLRWYSSMVAVAAEGCRSKLNLLDPPQFYSSHTPVVLITVLYCNQLHSSWN
jgi:hypothetical protein